ncbi:MAG TPA: hypothetical protein VMF65_08045, partial [Acidimicrobiales bacterium]|nr:hypothetical protein [Acidimicrobiales bacterium]
MGYGRRVARLIFPARFLTAAGLLTCVGLPVLGPPAQAGTPAVSPAAAGSQDFTEVWSHTLPDAGAPVALSSPNLATLHGAPAVVV